MIGEATERRSDDAAEGAGRSRPGRRPALRRAVLALIALAAVVAAAAPVSAAPAAGGGGDDGAIPAAQLTDGHVRLAIDAIVKELYARKDPRHFWDPAAWNPSSDGSKYQVGGYTALAVLALLHAGQSYQDPRLHDAVEHLARAEMEGTYARAVRASIWARLPSKFHENLEADTRWLLDGFSERAGGWTYTQKPETRIRDNSVTQFGALALWEAAKRGVEIDRGHWQRLEERFIEMQRESGGWDYDGDGNVTGSMTTAGLATLLITQDFLHAEEAIDLGPGGSTPCEAAIERGFDWMQAHFSPTDNPGSFRDYYYYAWGVERAGLAGGRKRFGPHDWFREMAAELIRRLCRWNEAERTMTVRERIAGTDRGGRVLVRHLAFGLIFLSRGRVPVAVDKLRVPDFRWNDRPRDVANLTHHLTQISEGELSWQIVEMDGDPRDWLDASMLYLASNRPVPWVADLAMSERTLRGDLLDLRRARLAGEAPLDAWPATIPFPAEARKLRRYLDLGGMLLAVNEGSARPFASSIEKLGALLYPEYEWRALPETHWAYRLHADVRGRRPPLQALGNGVRDLIVLSPGDLAASFQAGPPAEPGEDAGGRRGRRAARRAAAAAEDFGVAANLYFYASELNRPRSRLGPGPAPADPLPASAPHVLTVARAMYDGNWCPEPAALPALAEHLAGARGLDLTIVDRPLSTVDALDPAPALVVVCGIDEREFTETERAAAQRYVARGGVLLFETPGGTGGFTPAAERLCVTLFPAESDDAGVAPADRVRSMLRHPMITGAGIDGAADLSRVEYRPYAFQVFGARETTPRLRGLTVNGRVRVLFSREDISNALLDQPCWGVSGYTTASAQALMGNVLLYAGGEPAPR